MDTYLGCPSASNLTDLLNNLNDQDSWSYNGLARFLQECSEFLDTIEMCIQNVCQTLQ